MSKQKVKIIIDGEAVEAQAGQTILEAAGEAGIYIPHLCYHKDLTPGGHCRVCTIKVNGKPTNACTMPVGQGMVIENDTPELNEMRKAIIEMLFVEGNHICPACEKSGNCELQALAYRFQMMVPSYPYLFPRKEVDGSHPEFYIDRNRCILCGRCVRSSREIDKKYVFGFEGRGLGTRLAVDARQALADTDLKASDRAAQYCPTGSLVRKRVGWSVPVGKRLYDKQPIGADIEKKRG
jgi:[NiFe] hydrogenase diaphorase moiety small subunit